MMRIKDKRGAGKIGRIVRVKGDMTLAKRVITVRDKAGEGDLSGWM